MPGQWNTATAEYQREMMDAFSDPNVAEVVLMTSSQVGKSEVINNVVGFFVHQDPSPLLLVQPTQIVAQDYSKDRIAPMIRDTEVLKERFSDAKSRDSNNTLLHKAFPGGHLTLIGSNSPAQLASRPIRVVLFDEVDRYPLSAGAEGDPLELARARTKAFPNRKIGYASTPTVKGSSKIEAKFQESDQRKFYVPCHECSHEQVLLWRQVKWEKDETGGLKNAWYECEKCRARWSDGHRHRAVKRGHWVASAEFNGVAGFWVNELYGPFVKLIDSVNTFLKSKDDPSKLKTFVNTALGESWEEHLDSLDWSTIARRRESYGPKAPPGVLVITAGVDVQQDRLEVEVVGWGVENESWSLDYRRFYGDPAYSDVWDSLLDYLKTPIQSELGPYLRIRNVLIDSGGHHTAEVYRFTRKNRIINTPLGTISLFPSKGQSKDGGVILGPLTKVGKDKYHLQMIGTSTAKQVVYSWLKIDTPGPCFCHFSSKHNTDLYFEQLTAEKYTTKNVNGVTKQVWHLPQHRSNEALDCRVMALAALTALGIPWKKQQRWFDAQVEKAQKNSSLSGDTPEKASAVASRAAKVAADVQNPVKTPIIKKRRYGRIGRMNANAYGGFQ